MRCLSGGIAGNTERNGRRYGIQEGGMIADNTERNAEGIEFKRQQRGNKLPTIQNGNAEAIKVNS